MESEHLYISTSMFFPALLAASTRQRNIYSIDYLGPGPVLGSSVKKTGPC